MTPTPDQVAAAAAHLEELLASMYAGRSIRNRDEFKADLQAIQVAIAVLTERREG